MPSFCYYAICVFHVCNQKRTHESFQFSTGVLGAVVLRSGGRDLLVLALFHGEKEDGELYKYAYNFIAEVCRDTALVQHPDLWAIVTDEGSAIDKALRETPFWQALTHELCSEHIEVSMNGCVHPSV